MANSLRIGAEIVRRPSPTHSETAFRGWTAQSNPKLLNNYSRLRLFCCRCKIVFRAESGRASVASNLSDCLKNEKLEISSGRRVPLGSPKSGWRRSWACRRKRLSPPRAPADLPPVERLEEVASRLGVELHDLFQFGPLGRQNRSQRRRRLDVLVPATHGSVESRLAGYYWYRYSSALAEE
jgi:hypothetical protein